MKYEFIGLMSFFEFLIFFMKKDSNVDTL